METDESALRKMEIYLAKGRRGYIIKQNRNKTAKNSMLFVSQFVKVFQVLQVFMAFFTNVSAQNQQSENFECAKEFTLRKSGKGAGEGEGENKGECKCEGKGEGEGYVNSVVECIGKGSIF